MLESYGKDFKAVIIKNASMNNYKFIETNEKKVSFSTEIEDIREYSMGTLELKNIITKIKSSINGLNYKMEGTEEMT